jgi:hypothetical protein
MGMTIQFSEINTHMGLITDSNKCMEILKSTDAWELQKEDKARKLQRKRS